MGSVIDHTQYQQLASFRAYIAQAASSGNHVGMYHGIGQVQGFLLALHIMGEIDENDMASLEAETFANLDFLLNARKASNAHHTG